MLYGNQRLVYCVLLLSIHDNNLNPFRESRKPLSPPPATFRDGK
jgi:hypothetical protein